MDVIKRKKKNKLITIKINKEKKRFKSNYFWH